MASESQIERDITMYAHSQGCLCYKIVSPGRAGIPDRLVLLPNGKSFFMEIKKPSGRLSPLQANEIKRIKKHNHDAVVVWSLLEGKHAIDERMVDSSL